MISISIKNAEQLKWIPVKVSELQVGDMFVYDNRLFQVNQHSVGWSDISKVTNLITGKSFSVEPDKVVNIASEMELVVTRV